MNIVALWLSWHEVAEDKPKDAFDSKHTMVRPPDVPPQQKMLPLGLEGNRCHTSKDFPLENLKTMFRTFDGNIVTAVVLVGYKMPAMHYLIIYLFSLFN